MGGSERASSPPRLMSRGRGQTERNCAARSKERPLLSPNAFRVYLADGRQPFVPAASATTVCFEPIPSVPLFRGGSGRSSALINAPRSSDGWNITRTKAACQDNSSTYPAAPRSARTAPPSGPSFDPTHRGLRISGAYCRRRMPAGFPVKFRGNSVVGPFEIFAIAGALTSGAGEPREL
jgi:hypothetical protein